MSTTLAHSQPTVLRPQSLNELVNFANIAAKSTMLPQAYLGKPENIVIAVQLGSELGLSPMQALQNIAVIGGRPTVWGDAMIGLVRQSPLCEDIEEHFEGEGDKLTAVCVAKRVGKKPIIQSFSVEDAKKANLWGKAGPWTQYPKRMLQMRSRGFALRDAFPDVLRGLISAEEAADIPASDPFTGTTIEAKPEREAINESVPLKAAAAAMPPAPKVVDPEVYDAPPKSTPKRRTQRQFLQSLEIALHDAESAEAVNRILEGEQVLRAKELFTGEAKAKLDELEAAAIKAWWYEPPAPEGEELPEIVGEEHAGA